MGKHHSTSRSKERQAMLAETLKTVDFRKVLGDIASHEDYPTFCWLLDRHSESDQELSAWLECAALTAPGMAFPKPAPGYNDGFWLMIKRARSGVVGLFHDGNYTTQFGTQSRTRQVPSVLGRAGVVSIIRAAIGDFIKLKRPDLGQITLTDLARRMGEGSDEYESKEKSLRRLNAGDYVSSAFVQTLANFLKISPATLCFDHPAIYHQSSKRRQKTKAIMRRLEKLKRLSNYDLSLAQIEIDNEAVVKAFIEAATKRYIFRFQSIKTLQVNASQQERIHIFEQLPYGDLDPAKLKIKLTACIASLKDVGVLAWFATYDDVVEADPGSEAIKHEPVKVSGERIYRAVVLFTEKRANAPHHTVDRSGTLKHRPVMEDYAY